MSISFSTLPTDCNIQCFKDTETQLQFNKQCFIDDKQKEATNKQIINQIQYMAKGMSYVCHIQCPFPRMHLLVQLWPPWTATPSSQIADQVHNQTQLPTIYKHVHYTMILQGICSTHTKPDIPSLCISVLVHVFLSGLFF